MISKGAGITMVIIGAILFFIGILSWIIYIPVFSWWYFGEIGGIVLIIIGARAISRANRGF